MSEASRIHLRKCMGTRGLEFHSGPGLKSDRGDSVVQEQATGGWVAVSACRGRLPYKITGSDGVRRGHPLTRCPGETDDAQVARSSKSLYRSWPTPMSSPVRCSGEEWPDALQEAYGIANRTSVPEPCGYKVQSRSMNKMFTSVAIAQLVERGNSPLMIAFEVRP